MEDKNKISTTITKREFVEAMERLKQLHDRMEKMCNKLYEALGSTDKLWDVCGDLFTETVRQLTERTEGLQAEEWIEWYIYETDWGSDNPEVRIGDKKFIADSFDSLWEIILEMKKYQ